MTWPELVGKKIVALRGIEAVKYGAKRTELRYILFDDGETFIELVEQDRYDYHDCSLSARDLEIRKDSAKWKQLFDKEGIYDEPDDYP